MGLNVLIVDDNGTDRDSIVEIFRGWSANVESVASSRAAVASVKDTIASGGHLDVAVVDWRMPETDGIEVARAIKSLGMNPPPVIILATAYGREDVLRGAETAGIDAILVKPLDPSLLLETIAASIGAHTGAPTLPAGEIPKDLTDLHLLVAEDNSINQEVVTALLTDAGATVECVANGRLAVAKVCDGTHYDLVLMDLQMPEMDGFTATRHIREQFAARTVPIIAMTAHALAEERERCLAAGMNDHIAKPIDPPALIATVRRWCNRATLQPSTTTQAAAPLSPLAAALPMFDVTGALRRCLGDEAFLRRLFEEFITQFGSAAKTLPELHRRRRPSEGSGTRSQHGR